MNTFKVGDIVLIKNTVDEREYQKDNRIGWNPSMYLCIGKKGIIKIVKDFCISVEIELDRKYTFSWQYKDITLLSEENLNWTKKTPTTAGFYLLSIEGFKINQVELRKVEYINKTEIEILDPKRGWVDVKDGLLSGIDILWYGPIPECPHGQNKGE